MAAPGNYSGHVAATIFYVITTKDLYIFSGASVIFLVFCVLAAPHFVKSTKLHIRLKAEFVLEKETLYEEKEQFKEGQTKTNMEKEKVGKITTKISKVKNQSRYLVINRFSFAVNVSIYIKWFDDFLGH